jgi:beta-lactamase superfamily II metal-dependent hydrolase
MRTHRAARVCFGLVLVGAARVAAQPLEIHHINVGWGSSVFLKGPDGTTVLIEAGDTGMGAGRVVPYLQSIGVPPSAGLDHTIVGHQHCDHLGGLDEVINAHYDVRVRNHFNGSSYAGGCVTSWNAAAATTTAGAPVAATPGDQIPLGNGAKLTFVAVNGHTMGGGTVPVTNENDRSMAVLVQYGGFDYLWASDLGGGKADQACTGRSTTQVDVETAVVQAISPGGLAPLISARGIDVLAVSHHGSESSTNKNWWNSTGPAVAVINTGAGQTAGWDLPRIDVVEKVMLAQATACITAPAALVLQTEEGAPTGSLTSFAGHAVGNIKISVDGLGRFTVSADGAVSQGPNEVAAAGLPRTFDVDDATAAADLDLSNWKIVQGNSALTFSLPAQTKIAPNGYLIVARHASKAAFEAFWRGGTPLPANVVFVDAGGSFPVINGSETYQLLDAGGTPVDGPTVAMSASGLQSVQRKDPCLAPGTAGSWNVLGTSAATPGTGAGAGCAKGVVINEFSDATGTGNFNFEFVELHYDR